MEKENYKYKLLVLVEIVSLARYIAERVLG